MGPLDPSKAVIHCHTDGHAISKIIPAMMNTSMAYRATIFPLIIFSDNVYHPG